MSATTVSLEPATIHVWRGSLDQEPSTVARLESMLSRDEVERADRFHFRRDRARYVVGRGMLRALLGRYVGTAGYRLEFRYSEHRKPELVGDGPYFNVSHSGPTVLYAFSSEMEVGIDVELMRTDIDTDQIASRFFSPREVQALRELPSAEQATAFLTCWTRKEAFLKARGDGLSLELDSFDVTLAPAAAPAVLYTRWSDDEPSRWQLDDLTDADRGQVAAVAAPATGWRCVRHEIDVTKVVNN